MAVRGSIQLGLLGPLAAWRDGVALPLGGSKQRAVLGLLALERGRTVTTDALIEALWPEQAPGRPQTAIQGYVSQLRKALGPETIVTEANGYRLDAAPEQLDMRRVRTPAGRRAEARPGPNARPSSRWRSSSGAALPWLTSHTRRGRSLRSRGWKSFASPQSRRASTPTSSAAAAPSSSASSRRSFASSLYASVYGAS